jgi:hypothetical protein
LRKSPFLRVREAGGHLVGTGTSQLPDDESNDMISVLC